MNKKQYLRFELIFITVIIERSPEDKKRNITVGERGDIWLNINSINNPDKRVKY